MDSFRASSFRLRQVYGLPTWTGLSLFALLALALWYSIDANSDVERWIFLSMILLVLVHLSEVSQPFQRLEVSVLPFESPFAGEPTQIPVQISNQSGQAVRDLKIRIGKIGSWRQADPIAVNSAQVVWLTYSFNEAGPQVLPQIKIKSHPHPHFFLFWKTLKFTDKVWVLPPPLDHHVAPAPQKDAGDSELIGVEQIRDPRFLPCLDQKLLQKTGRPYRRLHHSNLGVENIELDWSTLANLAQGQQGEQFSNWLQVFSDKNKSQVRQFSVDAPFMTKAKINSPADRRKLKLAFAKWFYDAK